MNTIMKKYDNLEITPYWVTWTRYDMMTNTLKYNKIHLVIADDNNAVLTACGKEVFDGNGTEFENQSVTNEGHCRKCYKVAKDLINNGIKINED